MICFVVGVNVLEHLLFSAGKHRRQVVHRVAVADVQELMKSMKKTVPDAGDQGDLLKGVHDVSYQVGRDSCEFILQLFDVLANPVEIVGKSQ